MENLLFVEESEEDRRVCYFMLFPLLVKHSVKVTEDVPRSMAIACDMYAMED